MGQVPSFQEAPLTYGILVLGLLVVVVALFVLLRKKPEASQAVVVPKPAVRRDATVVFSVKHDVDKRPAGGYSVALPEDGTYLVPLSGDTGLPGTPIPVLAQSLYIGRDHERAQIVFDDPSVSRLHARLIEESDGVFILHDEGSASGTFVNDERVDLRPRQLKPGDLIEFGRQKVIFQCGDASRSDAGLPGFDNDQVEPLLPAED